MSGRDFAERLATTGVLVGDGGMGTMLQAAGLAPGGCPELWNTQQPDAVARVHQAYADAGAAVLTTNTFGGSPTKLAHYDLAERCEELNRAGAAIARRAADDDLLVAGSMGPTGALLAPFGPLSADETEAGYIRQAQALAEGGVDLLLVETMSDLNEAAAAVRAAAATGLVVVATMTFEHGKRGFFTVMGITPQRAAMGLAEAGADVVGANCGFGPDQMVALAQAFRAATDLPLAMQSNAGLPVLRGEHVRYPETPDGMAGHVADFATCRPILLGGCCGTTPAHIEAMVAAAAAVSGGGAT